jgi:carbon monoxide dehydrogenase subunit G
MELTGDRLIHAPIDRTWAALNDPEVLKACIAGCESLELIGPDAYSAVLAVRVGPVSAKFKGALHLSEIVPPQSYTMKFDGQGGVAGFGKGSAEVKLSPEGAAQTRLAYAAKAQVGGKLAQIGSRLVDAAAAKVADDFFQAFESRLAAEQAAAPPASPAPAPAGMPAWVRWAAVAAALAAVAWFATR